MNPTIHVDAREPSIARLLPGHKGREAQIRPGLTDEPFTFSGNYWDGGSKSDYTIVDVVSGKHRSIPTNQDFPRFRNQTAVIPQGAVVVEYRVFCGKTMPPVIHTRPGDLAEALPEPSELSEPQARCLILTASLKNSYGGESNIRQKRSGLSLEQWQTVQAECITKGWLRKNGSITREGRNQVETHPDRHSQRF
jgi:hypothetical protein